MTVNHDNRSVGGLHIRDILKALESKNTIDIEDCEINSISNAIESYMIVPVALYSPKTTLLCFLPSPSTPLSSRASPFRPRS
jgi:hypothetical protein